MNKWDQRFLDLAKLVASWSKDSTKVGAVVVDSSNHIIGVGFNGFPIGIADDTRLDDREIKLQIILHAEENLFAAYQTNMQGATIYTHPFMPCSKCAANIIQRGIKRVVAPIADKMVQIRWAKSFEFTQSLFAEAKVKLDLV